MDDLAPVPTQQATDQDRNQPDALRLIRKRSKDKKARHTSSGREHEEPKVEHKHNVDVLA